MNSQGKNKGRSMDGYSDEYSEMDEFGQNMQARQHQTERDQDDFLMSGRSNQSTNQNAQSGSDNEMDDEEKRRQSRGNNSNYN